MQFLVVYIAEAHALDGFSPIAGGNNPLVEEPVSDLERFGVAKRCMVAMELQALPAVIDRVDDKVNLAYAAWPDRLYLVGRDGKISYAGGQGPWGFKPDELEAAIKAELKLSSKAIPGPQPSGQPASAPKAPKAGRRIL